MRGLGGLAKPVPAPFPRASPARSGRRQRARRVPSRLYFELKKRGLKSGLTGGGPAASYGLSDRFLGSVFPAMTMGQESPWLCVSCNDTMGQESPWLLILQPAPEAWAIIARVAIAGWARARRSGRTCRLELHRCRERSRGTSADSIPPYFPSSITS